MPGDTANGVTPHPIVWSDRAVARLWDYYGRGNGPSVQYFAQQFGARILQRSGLPLRQGLDVLDFGCGPGFIWDHLRALQAQWRYTGLDFSPESLGQLQARAAGHDRFGGAHHVSDLPGPFADEHFDVVLLLEVIEHLDDARLDQTLRECHRVLRPGGTLVLTTPNDEDLSVCTKFCPDCGAVFHEWQHVRSWSVGTLETHLAGAGFRMARAQALDFAAHGFKRHLVRLGRRWLLGIDKDPHLIATFTK